MALTLQIQDGEVVSTKAKTTTAETSKSMGDQDLFLQLLVAEMKYQDPLEPTTNTEWVGQYATFTEVEKMTALADSAQEIEATSLVGKTVIMKSTAASGDTSYYSGVVSYLEKGDDGEVSLCVTGASGEKMFSMSELDSIVDPDYLDALTLAETFEAMMNALPAQKDLTLSSASGVTAARTAYDSMTTYQKQFVDSSLVQRLSSLESTLAKLKEAAESTEGTEG